MMLFPRDEIDLSFLGGVMIPGEDARPFGHLQRVLVVCLLWCLEDGNS